jgi:hypothetical protein
MDERVWVVMTTDHGWTQLAGIGATKAAALRLVAEAHEGKHEPDLEWLEDGSALCRVEKCLVAINPAEVEG